MLGFNILPFISVIYLSSLISYVKNNEVERSRVAIIGGGVGGTTAAYELSLLAVQHRLELDIDLYEPNIIGGRLSTISVNGFQFEAGGSIIHPENKYMQQFVEKFNLSKYHAPKKYTEEDMAGFYNGNEFVYTDSYYEIWSVFKFFWRYGFDLLSLGRQLVNPLLNQFKRIYMLQSRDAEPFEDVHEFLGSLDPNFPPLLQTSIKDLLITHGYGDRFVDEYVFVAMNVNYNQNSDIHAFVGAVALSAGQDTLWSVEGGNKKIPEALLFHSDAYLIKKKIQRIYLMPNSQYALDSDNETHVYDYVIVAFPLMENLEGNLKFEGFPNPIHSPVKYQKTFVTFVHGELNPRYFMTKDIPNHIFSVNSTLFFNSVSVVNPVTLDDSYDRKVYKIFSKNVLTDAELDLLFLTRDVVVVRDWLAYPQYDTDDKNLSFVLHDNLFYVNAIEWAASAMEMSAIAGVNAAHHVITKIKSNPSHTVIKKLQHNPSK